jgi:predicted Zn finger-like uncharacterized protein
MIAACPRCSARYRIDSERLRPEGVRLRCSRCEAVFRVRPPTPSAEAGAAPVEPDPALTAAPTPSAPPPEPSAGSSEPATPNDPEFAGDRSRLILIADPEVEQGKTTVGRLVEWGLQPILVHDGVEAILAVQRMLPRAIILDAALPKMFGFQVCELVKRNESLQHILVALVGAIHDPDRYRRPPGELYGADAYLERPDLPDGLRPILAGFGLPIATTEVAPPQPEIVAPTPASPPPEPVIERAEEPAAAPPVEPASQAPVEDPEIAKAERLARIVISDIILYNQEKFDAALRSGNVVEALASEVAEGRSLFAARIAAELRENRDFLAEELLRVARERGMK